MEITMLKMPVRMAVLFSAFVLIALSGCSQKDKADGSKENQKTVTDKKGDKKKEVDDAWWCKEHGVPEHECARCDDKIAAQYKKKGDWCMEHDRPESQCFICNPKRAEKFAASYRAKYGKEPPALPPEPKEEKN